MQDKYTINKIVKKNQFIEITWLDKHISKFHFLWLRDNCPSVIHPTANMRIFNILSVTKNIYPKEININKTGSIISNAISSEDDLVDKMGELAASLTRIETVNSHDEEYSLSIDKQIANDLEVDLSEAIMRLSRVSMAYQAAMQVGSQMLNNSLLNYL
mgnify:CR=1 FL=1